MAVVIKYPTDDELRARIKAMQQALKELDAWEARWGSRRALESDLEDTKWLFNGGSKE